MYPVCDNPEEHSQNFRNRGDLKFYGMFHKFIIALISESKGHMHP